jgi:hypothetical protein
VAGRPRGAAGLGSTRTATDLTNLHGRLDGLTGRPMVEVARATLDAGSSLVAAWRDLEPVVRTLTKKVRRYAERPTVEDEKAARLLGQCARVVQQVGAAAQGILRATEGQARLALLLEGGRPQRVAPAQLTERQLVSVVMEVAKKVKQEGGVCPVCTTTVEVKSVEPAAS